MDYAQAGNYSAQTAVSNGLKPVEAPRTISSAIGRIDGLNDRLAKVREHLNGLSDQIVGPLPTSAGEASSNGKTPPVGAVARLNDATEAAHVYIGDIENLLGSIGRALG